MFSISSLLLFIGAAILLIVVPGPDLIFAITQGISNGKKAGVYTALGLSFGNIIHTLAAALGLSIIFQTSAIVFNGFKIAGALYLFYIAYKSIKHRKEPISTDSKVEANHKGLLMRGFMMNILNPKVAIFFLTFLPQFVNTKYGLVPLQMIILGVIFIILTAIIFSTLAYFAGTFGQAIIKRPRFSEYTNIAASIIFIALAVKLLLTKQP
ncbi:LysE family translocator [Paenibacillus sediminis]|uniref:Threonine/homoserine/homoserine lactone efflux protein n=1 Tax=Paenibacillus sediminis TaxID=664909 RepID=A0ABS4H0D5_9BACL|nr:LysE family translocator [Paenibacillus sediminis]MBP1935975.1 threonine/homoserine/homoserine lactone efflux protein [Paenibacillus sediminis]